MDINFKGQRALVTGAGKGKIFFFAFRKVTKLYRERIARAPQYFEPTFVSSTKLESDLHLTICIVISSPLECGKVAKTYDSVLFKGIGRSTAKMLVECGAEVIALSRTQADLDSLKEEVRPGGGGGTPIWNRRGCSSEILNLTPKGDHLVVAQGFCDPKGDQSGRGLSKF